MRETEAIAILQTAKRNLNEVSGVQDVLLKMGLCKRDFAKAIDVATHELVNLRRFKKRLDEEAIKIKNITVNNK